MSQLSEFLKSSPALSGILKTVAPVIGTAIGGPFGAAAMTALASGLGESDPKALAAKIQSADPAVLQAMQKADQDFKAKMAEVGIQEEQLAAQDRDSARQREIKTGDIWTPRVLGAIAIAGAVGVAGFILLHGVDKDVTSFESGLIGTVVGYVFAEAKAVYNYYFGSSQGSKDKDAIMAAK